MSKESVNRTSETNISNKTKFSFNVFPKATYKNSIRYSNIYVCVSFKAVRIKIDSLLLTIIHCYWFLTQTFWFFFLATKQNNEVYEFYEIKCTKIISLAWFFNDSDLVQIMKMEHVSNGMIKIRCHFAKSKLTYLKLIEYIYSHISSICYIISFSLLYMYNSDIY